MTNTVETISIADSIINTYIPVTSTIVVAIATVVLVWLTSKYVRLTTHMVEDLKRSKEPVINVDFELPDHSLQLVLKNIGQSAAKNVKISILKDADWIRGHSDTKGLSGMPPFDKGVSYLVPGRTLKYWVGYPDWKKSEEHDFTISFQVDFENDQGNPFQHRIDIDMNQFQGVLFESFKDPSLFVADAIKETERSRRSQSRMTNMFNRPPQKIRCPICAESIMEKAEKCIHCGEWINKENPNKKVEPTRTTPVDEVDE